MNIEPTYIIRADPGMQLRTMAVEQNREGEAMSGQEYADLMAAHQNPHSGAWCVRVEDVAHVVDQAIADERERCAKIVEKYCEYPIAEEIRAGKNSGTASTE